jgi:hypothetical protein
MWQQKWYDKEDEIMFQIWVCGQTDTIRIVIQEWIHVRLAWPKKEGMNQWWTAVLEMSMAQ